eukprot:4728299-Pleurochrysis_carterae.AAC.2
MALARNKRVGGGILEARGGGEGWKGVSASEEEGASAGLAGRMRQTKLATCSGACGSARMRAVLALAHTQPNVRACALFCVVASLPSECLHSVRDWSAGTSAWVEAWAPRACACVSSDVGTRALGLRASVRARVRARARYIAKSACLCWYDRVCLSTLSTCACACASIQVTASTR